MAAISSCEGKSDALEAAMHPSMLIILVFFAKPCRRSRDG
jgi:hypothetical protein